MVPTLHNVQIVRVLTVPTAKVNHTYRPTVTVLVVMLVTVMIQSVTTVVLQRPHLITVTVLVTVLRLFVPNCMSLV